MSLPCVVHHYQFELVIVPLLAQTWYKLLHDISVTSTSKQCDKHVQYAA